MVWSTIFSDLLGRTRRFSPSLLRPLLLSGVLVACPFCFSAPGLVFRFPEVGVECQHESLRSLEGRSRVGWGLPFSAEEGLPSEKQSAFKDPYAPALSPPREEWEPPFSPRLSSSMVSIKKLHMGWRRPVPGNRGLSTSGATTSAQGQL